MIAPMKTSDGTYLMIFDIDSELSYELINFNRKYW